MAYSDVWTSANDAAFQGRCWAALWDVSNRVVDIEGGFPTGAPSRRFAKMVLRDEVKVTGRQLAQQVLRDVTIAANPGTVIDSTIQSQIIQVWDTLKGIG